MQPMSSSENQKSYTPSYASTETGREAAFTIFAGAARLKTIYGGSFTTPAKLEEAQRIASELLIEVRRLQRQGKQRPNGFPNGFSNKAA